MADGGKILGEMLEILASEVRPAIPTQYLNQRAGELVLLYAQKLPRAGIRPAFLGYRGFPAHICVSVNDEVVHGIPSDKKIIKEGDIVSLDFGIVYYGWNLDAAITCPAGTVSTPAQKLITQTRNTLSAGIEAIKTGRRVGAISHAIEQHARKNGLSVVRELVGHGIGRTLHEEPYVPNWGEVIDGPELRAGMVLAIEPMLTLGAWQVKLQKDHWTWKTKDGSLAAHFEHTVAITGDGPRVLTR